jgi:hypothetical protein
MPPAFCFSAYGISTRAQLLSAAIPVFPFAGT